MKWGAIIGIVHANYWELEAGWAPRPKCWGSRAP